MITLAILSILYSFFGLMRFKKIYGHYNVYDEDMKGWTLLIALTTIYASMMGISFIIKYLP
jgi:hypothetical protein